MFDPDQQAWYYSYSSVHTYPSQCQCQLYLIEKVGSGVCLLPLIAQTAFHLWGHPKMDLLASSCASHCLLYFTLENPLPLGSLRSNAFKHHWTCQDSYVSFSYIGSPGYVHASGRTCQRSFQTSYSGNTLLDGGALASHGSQHVRQYSSLVSHHKGHYHECFGRSGAPGSAINACTLWPLRDVCCVDKGCLSQSVRQEWG